MSLVRNITSTYWVREKKQVEIILNRIEKFFERDGKKSTEGIYCKKIIIKYFLHASKKFSNVKITKVIAGSGLFRRGEGMGE